MASEVRCGCVGLHVLQCGQTHVQQLANVQGGALFLCWVMFDNQCAVLIATFMSCSKGPA